ncbi:MAG: DUF456 family protein [Candidatus Rokubacteria bacterium]|nr:DUF456 family protein [Candidatus Rokubacteria bacterium]
MPLLAVGLAALNAVWLYLTALGLPGNWLMVVSTVLVALWQWEAAMFSPWVLVAILALALAGEALELLAGALGARRAGGTRRAAIGAVLGGLVGGLLGTVLIPVPLVGTLLGVGAGAFVVATGLEWRGGRALDRSLRAGRGAALGQSLGVLAKLGMGAVIWIVVTVAAFWP